MNPALPEILRITQDPSTESVARECRARGRAGIPASKMASDWPISRPCMRIRSLDLGSILGTGSRIPDPAMKLVGIPGVSRTCTTHRPCANWKLSAVLLMV